MQVFTNPRPSPALGWGRKNWTSSRAAATRIVPLFPEFRALLPSVLAETPEGVEHVTHRHRLGAVNLRTQSQRILTRAGIAPWPRLFQNLRASRESELMKEYDLATVCK